MCYCCFLWISIAKCSFRCFNAIYHLILSIVASTTIVRDCLSTLNSGFRTDLPADRYEGCRPASKDVRLAHYVFNNTIKELDIRRDHFDSTEFCYCFLDHRCNGATSMQTMSITSMAIAVTSLAILTRFMWARLTGARYNTIPSNHSTNVFFFIYKLCSKLE